MLPPPRFNGHERQDSDDFDPIRKPSPISRPREEDDSDRINDEGSIKQGENKDFLKPLKKEDLRYN